jgi:predicted DCC family thiol-disulfide oxidoreductase YuxK
MRIEPLGVPYDRLLGDLLNDARLAGFRLAAAAMRAPKAAGALNIEGLCPTADGTLLLRAQGVLHILRRLGGAWRVLATLAALVPAGLLDRAYDVVARVRGRLFGAPAEACPIVPAHLRARFDASP